MVAEDIYKELKTLQEEVARMKGMSMPFTAAHTDWSAHAKWSSGSRELLGDFDLSTKIGLPATAAQLDKIIAETTSTRFLEVARSLKEMLAEKMK